MQEQKSEFVMGMNAVQWISIMHICAYLRHLRTIEMVSPVPKPSQVALSQPNMMPVLVQDRPANLLAQLGLVKPAIPLSRQLHDSEPIDMDHIRHHARLFHAPIN